MKKSGLTKCLLRGSMAIVAVGLAIVINISALNVMGKNSIEETLPEPSIEGAVVFRGDDGKLYEMYEGVTVEINEALLDKRGKLPVCPTVCTDCNIVVDGKICNDILRLSNPINTETDPAFADVLHTCSPVKGVLPNAINVINIDNSEISWSFAALAADEANYYRIATGEENHTWYKRYLANIYFSGFQKEYRPEVDPVKLYTWSSLSYSDN